MEREGDSEREKPVNHSEKGGERGGRATRKCSEKKTRRRSRDTEIRKVVEEGTQESAGEGEKDGAHGDEQGAWGERDRCAFIFRQMTQFIHLSTLRNTRVQHSHHEGQRETRV